MNGGQLLALLACLPVMVAANVWVHVGPARWHVATGPVAAAVLLLIGRLAGLSWEQLGLGPGSVLPGLLWGGAAAACVLLGYAVGLAVPATRGLFLDERHRGAPGEHPTGDAVDDRGVGPAHAADVQVQDLAQVSLGVVAR